MTFGNFAPSNQLLPTSTQFRARDTPLHEEKLSEDDLDGVDPDYESAAAPAAAAAAAAGRRRHPLFATRCACHK